MAFGPVIGARVQGSVCELNGLCVGIYCIKSELDGSTKSNNSNTS